MTGIAEENVQPDLDPIISNESPISEPLVSLQQKSSPLDSISLPNAFRPEGIVSGKGSSAYVGSLANGSIYQVDLLTGKGDILVDSSNGVTVGLAFDERTNYLFAAGGTTGRVNIFNANDGELVATYQLANDNPFINDGIVTRDAAYFTNSQSAEIYKIPLSTDGELPMAEDIETIGLEGDFEFVEGAFNSNGIETTADGKSLLIVNSIAGKLYQVDPFNGQTTEILIANGDLKSGDGLLRRGNRIYVVQNRLNQISEVRLGRNAAYGDIVRVIKNDSFRVPTTVTSFRDDLYSVNARFGVEVDENTDFDIVRSSVRRKINR